MGGEAIDCLPGRRPCPADDDCIIVGRARKLYYSCNSYQYLQIIVMLMVEEGAARLLPM